MLDKKAYTEAYYIISKMSEEMRNKIPEKIQRNIQANMDRNYNFFIEDDDFENAILLEDTEKILSVLYTDYFATDEERKVILNKEKMLAQNKVNAIIDQTSKNNCKTSCLEENEEEAKEEMTKTQKDNKIISFLKNFFG